MLLFLLFASLSYSFTITKRNINKEMNSKIRRPYSIYLNNISIQKNKIFIRDPQCDYIGPTIDTTTIDVSDCKTSNLKDLSFKTRTDGSLIKIENLDQVKFEKCKFNSDSEISKSILVYIINTDTEIDGFDFDFKNLAENQYITSPILNLNGDKPSFDAIITLTVSNAKFGKNEETTGGILKTVNYNIDIDESMFSELITSDDAQDIYIVNFDQTVFTNNVTLSIENSLFIDISKSQFIVHSKNEFKIENCEFEGFSGPIFSILSNVASFKKCKFSNRNQTGYVINTTEWTTKSNFFDNCTFEQINGVSIYIQSNSENYFDDCYFIGNQNNEQDESSSICAYGHSSLYLIKTHFTDNSDGTVFIEADDVEMTECTFSNNNFHDLEGEVNGSCQGGALYIEKVTSLTLSDCQFTSNHASMSGGAIFVEYNEDRFDLKFSDCYFIDCSASSSGGAVMINSGNCYFNDCYFQDCKASTGGAICNQNETSINNEEEINMTNCIFDHCSGYKGGCVFSCSYKFILYKSVFENNKDDFTYDGFNSSFTNSFGHYVHSFLCLNMEEKSIDPIISHCSFSKNELHFIDVNVSSTLRMTNCIFDNYSDNYLLELSYIASYGTEEGNVFSGCIFQNCGTKAVFADKYNHTFTNCTFKNNINEKYYGPGALQIFAQARFSIFDCLFMNNVGNSNGGAIIVDSENIVELDNLTFINNSVIRDESKGHKAQDFGGALYVAQNFFPSEIKIVTIRNCYFESNHAMVCGGGIYCNFVDVTNSTDPYYNIPIIIENCTFINCSTTYKGGGIGSGMAYDIERPGWVNGDIVINDCFFKDCYAKYGGGIFSHDGTRIGDEETNITNCIFDHCSSDFGGCVYSCSYKFILKSSIFRNSIDDYKFDVNTTQPDQYDPDYHGSNTKSFLYLNMDEEEIDPVIENCTFTQNELHIIDINISGNLRVNDCLFDNYTNNNLLELSYIASHGTEEGNIFTGCIFQNCGTEAIFGRYYNHTFYNCSWINNTNTKYWGSGGMHLFDQTRFSIYDCLFINNVGCENGGALIIDSENFIELDNIAFINNSITTNEDKGDQAQDFGGALFVGQNFFPTEIRIVTIRNCYFENNWAHVCGGAIYCNFVDVTNTTDPYYDIPIVIENCTFINCSSKYKGGAVGSGMSRIVNGTAWVNGDIVVNDCYFKDCHSKYGGGVFSHDGTEIGDEETNITNCIFDHCYSELGSCIYSRSYLNSFVNCTFKNCIDEVDKDSIILFIEMDEKLVSPAITDCHFINNKNQQFHFVSEHSLKFEGCTFEQLSNEKDGGAIAINSRWKATNLEFVNCTFSGDKSTKGSGGAVYYSKEESKILQISFTKCIFTNLSSSSNGGALFISSSSSSNSKKINTNENFEIFINESTFSDCHANGSGGSIYGSIDAVSNIENCVFEDINADSNGNSLFFNLNANLKLKNIAIKKKSKGKPEIYITGKNENAVLELDGGCFQSAKKDQGESSPDFLYFESAAKIKFNTNACFSGSQEESIYVNKQVEIDSSIFNCDTCRYPPMPTLPPVPPGPETQTETETQEPESESEQPQTETHEPETETEQPQTETEISQSESEQTETQEPETETEQPQTETHETESETEQPFTHTATQEIQSETEQTNTETETEQPHTETQEPESASEQPLTQTETQHPQTETEQPVTQTDTVQPVTETQIPETSTPIPFTETSQSQSQPQPPSSSTDTQTLSPTDSPLSPTPIETPTPTDSSDDSASKIKKLSIVVTVMIVLFVVLILAVVIFAIVFFIKRKAMQNPYLNADQIHFASQSEASSLSRNSLDTNRSENSERNNDVEFDNAYSSNKLNPDPFMRDFEENI